MRGGLFTLLARFLHSVRLRRTSVEMTTKRIRQVRGNDKPPTVPNKIKQQKIPCSARG